MLEKLLRVVFRTPENNNPSASQNMPGRVYKCYLDWKVGDAKSADLAFALEVSHGRPNAVRAKVR